MMMMMMMMMMMIRRKSLWWWGNERRSCGELHKNQQGGKTYHEWDEDDAHIDD